MTLIENWKQSGKLWSIRAAIALILFNLLLTLLSIFEAYLPQTLFATLNAIGAAGVALSRLISQNSGATAVAKESE